MRTKCCLILFFYLLPLIIPAQNDSIEKIKALLDYSLEELMRMEVVSASVSKQTVSIAPSTIHVITAQQIEERGYEELGDVLRDVPGIDLIHLNGYVPTLIYFRGMYGADNLRALVMIDGIPENNIAGTLDLVGPAYSLHNVERIEIVYGPSSSVYGANAFGGVINIITKKAEDINGLKIQRGQGNMNTSFERATYGMKKGSVDLLLSGSVYRTDGPVFKSRGLNYSGSYVDNAHSFSGAVGYANAKCKTALGIRMFRSPMGWGQILNSPNKLMGLPAQTNGNAGTAGILSENFRGERPGRFEPYSRTYYLQNTYTPNSKWTLYTLVEYRETGIADQSYTYITVDGKLIYRLPTAQYSNRFGGKTTATYVISDKHKISAGVEVYQDNLEEGSRKINLDTNKYTVNGRFQVAGLYSTFGQRKFIIWNNFGSFLQYELYTKWLRETNFIFGTRYDINSVYGNPISPRIAIINKPSDRLTIKLMYGAAYRAPTITEVIEYKTSLGTRNSLANFDLKPEKVRTYEFNILYNPIKELLLQLNAFRNELSDIIVLTTLQTGGYTQNQNIGSAFVNGLEAKVDATISKKVSAFLNVTYQAGEQTARLFARPDSTFNIPNIAAWKGNVGITIHVADLFYANVVGNWVGKRSVLGTNPYGPVDGYFVTNCVITTHKFFNDHFYISLTVKNLFDSKYLDPGIRTADGILYSTVLEQPRITGILKITASF